MKVITKLIPDRITDIQSVHLHETFALCTIQAPTTGGNAVPGEEVSRASQQLNNVLTKESP